MSWYEALKDAMNVAEQLKDAKLTKLLATVTMEGAKLAQENASLREELTALREAARMRQALTFREDVYWLDGDGEESEGPFCQKCWDGEAKLVRLTDHGENRWRCTVCKECPWKPGGEERFRNAAVAAHNRAALRRRPW